MAVQPTEEKGGVSKAKQTLDWALCCQKEVVYRIQLGPKSKPKVVHRNRLWKYRGQDPPQWLMGTKDPPPSDHPLLTRTNEPRSSDHTLPPENASRSDINSRRSKRLRKPPERLAMKVTLTSPGSCDAKEGSNVTDRLLLSGNSEQ